MIAGVYGRAAAHSTAIASGTKDSDRQRSGDARGINRTTIPPSPSVTPTPPRVVRSNLLNTHTNNVSSDQIKFVPIHPATTTTDTDAVSLHSTETSCSSTPRSRFIPNTSSSVTKHRSFLSGTSGKRALDLEELGMAEPLSQGSAKRRLAEVTPVLPPPPVLSTVSSKSRGAEDVQSGNQARSQQIGSKQQNKQGGLSGQSGQSEQDSELLRLRNMSQANKPNHRHSPESVYSERTENMFVSASDGDSDSSSV